MSDNIPEEILIEILLKVPAKSLIRSTSVCKAWQSLIRSPSFISLHLSNTESQILLGDCNNNQRYALVPKREPFSVKVIDITLKCPIKKKYYRIVGSCDGLMCFSKTLFFSKAPWPPVIVWNPTIRKQVVSPQSFINQNIINQNKVDDVLLVLLGFGVASNVYKVVRLVFYINHPPRAEIFTLGTGTWRKLSAAGIDAYTASPYLGYSWFFKGFLHWICKCKSIDGSYCDSILTFHVGDEVFGEILFPEEFKGKICLAIIGESFGAINHSWEMDSNCDVWIMKDYCVTESWTKLYSICWDGFNRVIAFLDNSEFLLGSKNGLVTYNAESIKHVGDFGENIYRSWYTVDNFKESLVLLGGYSQESREESSLDTTSTIPTCSGTKN